MFVPRPRPTGFSLVEVVVAIGVISFALLSILGLLSISMTVHQDASIDSVLSIMTETAMQELRNYNTPNASLATASNYSFSKIAPGYTGYIYFNQDGQITADAYWTGANSSGTPTISPSTAANQSTEVGVNMNGGTFVTNGGKSGVPLANSLAVASQPAGTYYTCNITTSLPTLYPGSTAPTPTPSMYLVTLKFTWLSADAYHTRTVATSISNNTN